MANIPPVTMYVREVAPPLCILQMRLASTRLPQKMLQTLGDETLAARGWRIACEAFGEPHCVVAIPAGDEAGPLGDELRRIGATIFAFDRDENDVLERFHACAHRYRWHPDSIIVRYTADDPWKSVEALRLVASGRRLPVEEGGEAFTLAMLDEAHLRFMGRHSALVRDGGFLYPKKREHLTQALFDTFPPPASAGAWTIDTPQQLDECRRLLASGERT